MKYLFFLISIGIAGSYTYKHFIGSPENDSSSSELSSHGFLPPIPQQCEDRSDNLEDAILNHEAGKLTIIEVNQFTRRFQSCLLAAGFTDAQVYRTYDAIVEVVLNTDPGNLGDGSAEQ